MADFPWKVQATMRVDLQRSESDGAAALQLPHRGHYVCASSRARQTIRTKTPD